MRLRPFVVTVTDVLDDEIAEFLVHAGTMGSALKAAAREVIRVYGKDAVQVTVKEQG